MSDDLNPGGNFMDENTENQSPEEGGEEEAAARPAEMSMDDLMAMVDQEEDMEIQVDGVEEPEPEEKPEKAVPQSAAAKAAKGLQAQAMKAMQEAQQMEKDHLKTKISELEKDLEFQRENYQELVETAKRRQADFENFRKRVGKEKEEARREGKAKAALGLIGILDNLNRALEDVPESVPQDWLGGIQLTHRQFGTLLEQWEIKEVPGQGEEFDPTYHEAFMTVEGEEANKVVQVFERGYMIGDRLLRAAKVSVSKAAAGNEAPQESAGEDPPPPILDVDPPADD